jgi:non-specific serine/threonine protein kinase
MNMSSDEKDARPPREPEATMPSEGRNETLPSLPPESIGPYPIVGEVGRGGMGVVYAAEDTKLKRRVAIKVLPEEFARDPERVESFRREARHLAALNHPNIATIHSLEESDGDLFITMELIPGDTLDEKTERGPLRLDEILSICCQIARALDAAHKKNVVHRDLKPQNIKFTSEGLVKVLDFGLAQVIEVDDQVSHTTQKAAGGPLMGTPGYMSPEQLRGEDADHRTDIWGFGCLLYKCLTGRSPFPGKTIMEKAAATMNKDPDWELLPKETPPSLRELVQRCLTRGITERLASMSEVLKIVEDVTASRTRLAEGRDPAESPPNNLPIPLGNFIGRDKEKQTLRRMLSEHRMVTLTGTGGSGKTRLALETAAEILGDFGDGVFFIDLAPLTEPDRIPRLLARVLEIREESGRSLADSLLDTVRKKSLLLILDNCEHLPAACAQWALTILQAGRETRILATSRERLRIVGEAVYMVPNLPIPDCTEEISLEEIGEFESIRLFMDRARAIDMSFELTEGNAEAVCSVCRQLDGIPLALELAAARIRILPVEEIALRLEKRFRLLTKGSRSSLPHHQTLRTLIDWSYDLLSPDEQRLFRSLSAFAGGWTLEAAGTTFAGEDADEWDVLELHSHLMDKSLIERTPDPSRREDRARFRMLETIREYARDRLDEAGETGDALHRHRRHFADVVRKAEPLLSGPEQTRWIHRLDAEHENLRQALRSFSEEEDAAPALRMAGDLGRYWYMRGHWSEGRDLCASLLSKAGTETISKDRADVLNWAGNLAFSQADFDEARRFHEESLQIRKDLGDRKGVSASLNNLGTLFQWQGHLDQALSFFQDCLKTEQEIDDRQGVAGSLSNIGGVHEMKGEFDKARGFYERSLEIRRDVGNRWGIAVSLNNLGVVADQLGDYEDARGFHEESLKIRRELGNKLGIAESLNNLNIVVIRQGDTMTSKILEREALKLNLELRDPVGLASSLGISGARAEAERDLVRSIRLRGSASALRDRYQAPLPPAEQESLEQVLSRLRETLGDQAFDKAWEEGYSMSQEDAVRYALSDDIA